jgi:hypothetical protein
MEINRILWRRLDAPGHDACRLLNRGEGWLLEGSAVFRYEAGPACITYEVECDHRWHTREGQIHGWVGAHPLDWRISRTPNGQWANNDDILPGLDNCVDLDIGFTPATNLFQLRRLALQIGQTATFPVAWFDIPDGSLAVLNQRYERRSAEQYWYEAPRFDYYALLKVRAVGFVEHYPNLWEAESGTSDYR